MSGHTVILRGDSQRQLAKQLIDKAPADYVVTINEPKRNLEQNARMWACLSDISRAKPGGRVMTPDDWKFVMMRSCGHEVRYLNDLEGNPFPVGLSSSKLSVSEMATLLEFVNWFCAENNIELHDYVEVPEHA